MWTLQETDAVSHPGGGTQQETWVSQGALGWLAALPSCLLSKAPDSKQERVKSSMSHWRRKW